MGDAHEGPGFPLQGKAIVIESSTFNNNSDIDYDYDIANDAESTSLLISNSQFLNGNHYNQSIRLRRTFEITIQHSVWSGYTVSESAITKETSYGSDIITFNNSITKLYKR